MEITKSKIATVILALMMLASALLVFSSSSDVTVNAAVPSDMLQYEWVDISGDKSGTFTSDGPGPTEANIAWKAEIPSATGYLAAFNGLVFTEGNGTTWALDGGTGEIVWTAPGVTGGDLKLDDTYMLIGTTCVRIADGTTVWTAPEGFVGRGSLYMGTRYDPDLQMFVTGALGESAASGWSLTDPSQPPTLVWDLSGQNYYGEARLLALGEGKAFIGCGDSFIWCVDILTGNTEWITPTTDRAGYGGTYYEGKFIHGALDNNMHCWDAETGELLWSYCPHTWYGMFASATGAAYGMVYEHNQDNYLYAIDVDTGELVWRSEGPGIGYSNTLSIAGGYVYCQMGENQYRNFATGEYAYSEFNCYDAYTGELVWSIPMENHAPFNIQCNAYGNLYLTPNKPTPQEPGVWTYSLGGVMSHGEVWCISNEPADYPMYMTDPEHSNEGAGPTTLKLRWATKTSAVVQSAPALVDGVCYFGNQLGTIYALDADTGSELWTFQTDAAVKSSVAVVDGKLYTGTDDGNIYCLDASTGAELWETYAGGVIINPLGVTKTSRGADHSRSSPIVFNNRVYVGALDGNLYCLDADTGAVIWQFVAGLHIMATPTIVDNAIYIPVTTEVPNGTVYKLDMAGNVIWQKEIPYNLTLTAGDGGYMLASATVAEGMVFVRSALRANYALNATTGDIIWTYDARYNPGTPFQSGGVHQFMPMLYKYGALYFNDYYGITCLDAANGTEIWHTYLSRESLAQGVSYAYKRIYTVTEFGVLFVLDALSGEKLSYYEFSPAGQMRCTPIPYNGNLYVGTCEWTMFCFGEARLMGSASQSSVSASTTMPIESTSGLSEAPLMTTELAILAAVVVACLISVASYLTLRKRK